MADELTDYPIRSCCRAANKVLYEEGPWLLHDEHCFNRCKTDCPRTKTHTGPCPMEVQSFNG